MSARLLIWLALFAPCVEAQNPTPNGDRPQATVPLAETLSTAAKPVPVRFSAASESFKDALYISGDVTGIHGTVFVHAVEGCYGPLRTQEGYIADTGSSHGTVSAAALRLAYDKAHSDTTPLDQLPSKAVSIRVPDVSRPITMDACAVAATFTRTEAAYPMPTVRVVRAIKAVNANHPAVPSFRLLASVPAPTRSLSSFLEGAAALMPKLLSIFFGETDVDVGIANVQQTSPTSCLVRFGIDSLPKIRSLESFEVGATLSRGGAVLEERQPDHVSGAVSSDSIIGVHYPLTVARHQPECPQGCVFSWFMTDDAVKKDGWRKWQVHFKNITPPLAPGSGKFEIKPYVVFNYHVGQERIELAPILDCKR